MQIDPTDIADLTTLVFAAALNPARWGELLERLHVFTGGVRTHLFGRDTATNSIFGHLAAGYDPAFLTLYENYYRNLNVWAPSFVSSPNGTVKSILEMTTADKLRRTEFYNDWVRPQDDMYGGCGAMIFNDGQRFIAFGGHIRGRDVDKLNASWVRLAKILTPQIQQAFEINRLLDGKVVSDFVVQSPHQSSLALLLIRSDRRLLFANDTAQMWIARGTPLLIDASGRIDSADQTVSLFVERSIKSLDDTTMPASSSLRHGDKNQGSLFIYRAARFIPDRQNTSPFGILNSGTQRALLLTVEAKKLDRTDFRLLLRQYRLTETEIAVALDLSMGMRASEIAEQRNVSINTIRNQRQAILSKMDLHRQSDLARLLLSLDGH